MYACIPHMLDTHANSYGSIQWSGFDMVVDISFWYGYWQHYYMHRADPSSFRCSFPFPWGFLPLLWKITSDSSLLQRRVWRIGFNHDVHIVKQHQDIYVLASKHHWSLFINVVGCGKGTTLTNTWCCKVLIRHVTKCISAIKVKGPCSFRVPQHGHRCEHIDYKILSNNCVVSTILSLCLLMSSCIPNHG